MKRLCIWGALLAFASYHSANSVAAKSPQTDSPDESSISFVYACAEISDSTRRLTCFDQAVAKLQTDEQSKELVVISATQANKLKKEAFGFRMPSVAKLLPKLGHGKQKEELVDDVKSVRKSGRNYVFTLKNGQVWRQINGDTIRIPKGELTATIKPKALGSFLMSLDNGKRTASGFRVKRVK